MLLLLLLLHNAIASDYSKDANYTVRRIPSCPDQGYFFKQELGVNDVEPTHCYLCFCKGDGIAVCWQRNKALCNKKVHRNEDSDPRSRRSSAVVTDNLSRNSLKKYHSQRNTYKCKPIGFSLSKGCPPDDWCLGCTLCDCDVTGRWSCHLLSVCSDKKLTSLTERASKIIQNFNDTVKRYPIKVLPKPEVNKNKPKVHKYVKKLHTSHKCDMCLKASNQDFSLAKSDLGLPRHDDTIVVIEKDLVGRTPMEVQGVRVKKVIHDNSANVKLAHKIVHRAMAAVHKIINKNEKNTTNVTKLFKVQKRSMSLRDKQAKLQEDNMSPQMYMKTSPRKYCKKILVNQDTMDNFIARKKRVRRNVSYEAWNKTQMGHLSDYVNLSINKTSQTKQSRNKSEELNKLEYFKYNVLETKSPVTQNINISTDAAKGLFDVDHFNVKIGNVNTTIKQNRNNSPLAYSSKNKTDSNLENIQDKKRSRFISGKTNFLKEIKKKRRIDTKLIDLMNVLLNGKGTFAQNVSNKAHLYKHLSQRTDFITYLKGLLNKIFTNSENVKSFSKSNTLKRLTKQNFLGIFCTKNFLCNIRPADDIKLQIKINDLNSEMYKILETTKIIYKILVDVDFNEKSIDDKNVISNQPQLDFRKESFAVFKDGSATKDSHLQLYYLKDSFNTFIQSIERFSNILHDILHILTGKIIAKKNPRSSLRWINSNAINYKSNGVEKINKKIEKLKTILLNFKVFQNIFIKSIYDVLTKMESNLNTDERRKKMEITGCGIRKELNHIHDVETYPKNIAENLKKLAQRFFETHRNKRSAMRDDDAIEYLLVLMEYLLKQNYPLDAAPVNDGIDLLIDAIKHAPDIKPIKKKIFYNSFTRTPATRTTPKVTAETFSYVDNIYGIDSLERGFNDTSHSDGNQIEFTPVIDEDERIEDLHKLLQDSKQVLYQQNQIDFVTSAPIVTTTPMIRYDFFKDNTDEPVHFDESDKLAKRIIGNVKNIDLENIKYYINNPHKERVEEYAPMILTPATESDLTHTITYPTRTLMVSTTRKFHHVPKDKFVNPDTLEYKRKKTNSKFSWIDYDQEENGSKLVQRKSMAQITSTTVRPKKHTDVNDISSITKEILEEFGAKPINKMLPSAMFNKLNLINSKEDGARKSDLESESKDVEQEDTYVNDIFPSYFT